MNNYLQRLVKLIPGEAITMHLTIINLIKGVGPDPSYQYLPLVGFTVTLIVRIFGTKVDTQEGQWDVEWTNVMISAISFILWVYATGGAFPWIGSLPQPSGSIWVGVAIMLWTFLVPYFYKPDTKPLGGVAS